MKLIGGRIVFLLATCTTFSAIADYETVTIPAGLSVMECARDKDDGYMTCDFNTFPAPTNVTVTLDQCDEDGTCVGTADLSKTTKTPTGDIFTTATLAVTKQSWGVYELLVDISRTDSSGSMEEGSAHMAMVLNQAKTVDQTAILFGSELHIKDSQGQDTNTYQGMLLLGPAYPMPQAKMKKKIKS
jgi:hypothetical protein